MLCRSMESAAYLPRQGGFFSKIISLDVEGLRFCSLMAAMAVYAFRGSPTPDNPGWPEVLTGLLLLAAVGVKGGVRALTISFSAPMKLWQTGGKLFLLYGLSVPLLAAGIVGHGTAQVLRDLLPFAFFLMPTFLTQNFERRPEYGRYLLFAAIALGFVFALRALLPFYPFSLLNVGIFPESEELFYFANAPTVFLAALMLLGFSGKIIMGATGAKDIARAVILFGLSLLPLLAMAAAEQRAGVGVCVLYAAMLTLLALWRSPARAARLLIAILLVVSAAFPVFMDAAEILGRKTSMVGLNMRDQEAKAVWDAVSGTGNPAHIIFGLGWGGGFHSPAVGGVYVNFTHSLLTSMLLKTGLVGVFLACTYLAGLLSLLTGLLFRHPLAALALLAPFLVDIFLYASFKSLDFGLVLLLIPVYTIYINSQKP